jgi:hypothetical protein
MRVHHHQQETREIWRMSSAQLESTSMLIKYGQNGSLSSPCDEESTMLYLTMVLDLLIAGYRSSEEILLLHFFSPFSIPDK